MTVAARAQAIVCRRIRVRGQVQGVGFRPFVYRLAQELNLAGWVRNDGEGVDIEVQGAVAAIEDFIARLETETPPLASVTAVEAAEAPTSDVRGFEIKVSRHGTANTSVTPPIPDRSGRSRTYHRNGPWNRRGHSAAGRRVHVRDRRGHTPPPSAGNCCRRCG